MRHKYHGNWDKHRQVPYPCTLLAIHDWHGTALLSGTGIFHVDARFEIAKSGISTENPNQRNHGSLTDVRTSAIVAWMDCFAAKNKDKAPCSVINSTEQTICDKFWDLTITHQRLPNPIQESHVARIRLPVIWSDKPLRKDLHLPHNWCIFICTVGCKYTITSQLTHNILHYQHATKCKNNIENSKF